MNQDISYLENFFTQKFNSIEKKFDEKLDKVIEAVAAKKEEEVKENIKDITYTLELEEEIRDLDNFDAILEQLNQKANTQGYAFKKGVIKKYKDKPATSRHIVCKYFDRNKSKTSSVSSKSPTDKILIKNINCQAFYRFNIRSDGSVSLVRSNQEHNHGPYFGQKVELTSQMKVEIGRFNKSSKISEVKEHMEVTFGIRFDYWCIYNEFRRQFPRLGEQDCHYFLQFLDKNQCLHRKDPHQGQNPLCKLLFVTPKMLQDYTKYSDILLVDTTYNTNYYSIPLVVFCGVDNNYRNVMFGLCLINDETSLTYRWILRNFLELTQIKPKLIISDNDLALSSAIAEEYNDVPHRLCSWHLARSLRRNFGFIKSQYQDIKERIFQLPYLWDQETFDKYIEDITKFLSDNKYSKSIDYLTKVLSYKEKWARSYHPLLFDGGITTTSRVESLNAAIKRYLDSRSEISDIIKFIEDSEKCEFIEKSSAGRDISKFLEIDPLLNELSNFLPSKVMLKQFEEYSLSKKYSNKQISKMENKEIYEVQYDRKLDIEEGSDQKVYNKHKVVYGSKITCDCEFYERTGLICRHILHICAIKNEKTLTRLVIRDRWRRSLILSSETHFKVIDDIKKEDHEKMNVMNIESNQIERASEVDNEILSSSEESYQEILEEKPLEEENKRGGKQQVTVLNFEKKN